MHMSHVFVDSHLTVRCQFVIISIFDEFSSNYHFETKFKFLEIKTYWMFHLQGSDYLQNHLSFVGSEFLGSHHRLRMPFYTFWNFTTRVYEPVQVFHPRKCLALLANTRQKFFTFYNSVTLLIFVQYYRAHSSTTKYGV